MKKDIVTSAPAKKTATKPAVKANKVAKKAVKTAVKKAVKKVAPVETEVVEGKKPAAFEERTWYEFQQGGFLLFINLFLQIFGWSIVMHVGENGLVTNVYPARTSYRGFGPEELSKAYVRVSEFLVKHGKKLLEEARD